MIIFTEVKMPTFNIILSTVIQDQVGICLLLLTVWQAEGQDQALNTTGIFATFTKKTFPENCSNNSGIFLPNR